MSAEASTINEQLNLGIAAARAGRSNEAQSHLTAVLRIDPQNIPAMFWLAFVVPAPQDSLRLLEHVLALDPTNERAKAGLRWAKSRLDTAATPPVSQPVTTPTKVTPTPLTVAPTIAQTVPSPVSPRPAPTVPVTRPRQPVSKPRRSTWPRLAVALSVGVLALLALTLGVLLIVPPDTLAAWWPRPTDHAPVVTEPAITFVKPETTDNLTTNRLVSAADTLPIVAPDAPAVVAEDVQGAEDVAVEPATEAELTIEEASKPVVSNMTLAEEVYAAVDPAMLIGPDIPATAPEPVENLLLAHQPATPDEKWIEVNVTTQQITAWEGTTPVFSFIGSTGLPNTPTVLGKFNVYWKLESTLMAGPGYYLPEVPYTMYFYAGYALHGAYWHNNFGQPMSHGCVNLETGDAKKLFEWATPIIPPGQTQVVATADNPGTLVVVHE